MKQVLKIISIADIHMGALDPQYMYNQLHKQFVQRINGLDFDVLAICGDIFHAKYMSNNPTVTYTIQLIDEIVNVCRIRDATLLLLAGTASHDNGQLSLFYHYLQDPTIDIRIVENIGFENIKGMRCLCLPEKYGVSADDYKNILFESGGYDICFMHGTIKGSIYGAEMEKLDSDHAPVFSLRSFSNCSGLILAGHVHVPGCFEEYIYYNGSPLRFKFGEEQTKGFLVTLFNPQARTHYTELVPIDSYIYNTITIDHLMQEDPKKIIDYIKHIKCDENIDFIRVQFSNPGENMNVVSNYFRNNGNVKLQELNKNEKQQQVVDNVVASKLNEYSYILDNNMSEYDKFTTYINQNEGYEFITTDDLISILEGDI